MVVRGYVQGVGFRYYVYRQAIALGICGNAKNLYSGEVEIEAFGERSLLEEFIKIVKVGPRAAHVTDVVLKWKEDDPSVKSFEIG